MWAVIPPAEKLFQTSLDLIRSNLLAYMLIFLSLAILIGAASGIYASSYLSRLKVLQIIQGKTTFGKRRRALRSMLIMMQLIIFCAFVSGTLLIRSQHRFALQRDPGHLREHVLQIYLGRDFKGYEPYLDAVRNYSDVISAAGVRSGLPRLGFGTYMQDHFQDKEKKVQMEGISVDYGAMETLGISVVQGRDFSREFGSDLGNAVLINEKAVKELGIVDPLGVKVGGRTVIGVVKDFNVHSIHSDIPPLSISLTDRYIRNILVRYRPGNLTGLLAVLKEEWKKVEPDMPFRYDLMEDLFQAVYAEEKNLSTILALASLFALLIATFGLFGLTLFMAKARTQEIGIRKVMGSSERNIVWLFLKSYLFLILIAGLAAIPVTWWFTKRWLEQFAYRVDIHWWLFLPAFILALVVVLPTVYLHARKASRINPVEAIRYE
jgi:putative ABC transport system permease protein